MKHLHESQCLTVNIFVVRPNWLKKLFTDFITLTVKLVIKGQVRATETNLRCAQQWFLRRIKQWQVSSQIQICKEINKAANILADFIQDTAGTRRPEGSVWNLELKSLYFPWASVSAQAYYWHQIFSHKWCLSTYLIEMLKHDVTLTLLGGCLSCTVLLWPVFWFWGFQLLFLLD